MAAITAVAAAGAETSSPVVRETATHDSPQASEAAGARRPRPRTASSTPTRPATPSTITAQASRPRPKPPKPAAVRPAGEVRCRGDGDPAEVETHGSVEHDGLDQCGGAGTDQQEERAGQHGQQRHDDDARQGELVELHAEDPRGIEDERGGDPIPDEALAGCGRLLRQSLPHGVGEQADVDDRPDREGGSGLRDGSRVGGECAARGVLNGVPPAAPDPMYAPTTAITALTTTTICLALSFRVAAFAVWAVVDIRCSSISQLAY